jgi:transposase
MVSPESPAIEREAKQREPTDYEAFVALRHKLREERSVPIFEKFHTWLVAELPKVLPKSLIGEAIQYALNHWVALKRPLEAGFLELDSGACERAFKPVALGRKNWLFAGSDKAGQTAAVLMSLCATCKEMEINPRAYLRDVLDRISTHPARRIEELLPERWKAIREANAAARDRVPLSPGPVFDPDGPGAIVCALPSQWSARRTNCRRSPAPSSGECGKTLPRT